MSRWIWILFIVVLSGGILAYVLSLGGTPVDVAVAEAGEIRIYVEERAKTRLPKIFRVSMPLAGRIQPIQLQAGDEVSACNCIVLSVGSCRQPEETHLSGKDRRKADC